MVLVFTGYSVMFSRSFQSCIFVVYSYIDSRPVLSRALSKYETLSTYVMSSLSRPNSFSAEATECRTRDRDGSSSIIRSKRYKDAEPLRRIDRWST